VRDRRPGRSLADESEPKREKLPPEQYTAKYWTDKIAEFDAANPEHKKWYDSLGAPDDSAEGNTAR
jgi:hypothetical protein